MITANGSGNNRLGYLLMVVREELRAGKCLLTRTYTCICYMFVNSSHLPTFQQHYSISAAKYRFSGSSFTILIQLYSKDKQEQADENTEPINAIVPVTKVNMKDSKRKKLRSRVNAFVDAGMFCLLICHPGLFYCACTYACVRLHFSCVCFSVCVRVRVCARGGASFPN